MPKHEFLRPARLRAPADRGPRGPASTPARLRAFVPADGPPLALLYLDVVLVLIVAVPALALGAPVLGYTVGAAAWILLRVAQEALDRQLLDVRDLRRRLGLGVAFSMARVWLLAGAIIAVGIAGGRADGLTAALLIFGAFSLCFVRSAFVHMTRSRGATR